MDPITLPISGKVATFRKLKGRDLIAAERGVYDPDSRAEKGFSYLAAKTLLNGVQATLEDILDLDEDDINALMEAVPASPKALPSALSS